MGAVYEAHHLRLQKRVAVKLMTRTLASQQEALARFHREASVASRLGHPHLVNVVDFGSSEDGQPYLVMEFLEGEDLERRIQRAGRVPVQKALQIARQTASAVAAVHAKGIVHRDLKPANIFLVQVPGEPDFVKVLDFGVSKIRASRTKLTDDSRVVGTPEYMSPEQVSGSSDEVDHRTDQWALACIVWEMLAGRSPFSADDPNALFYQLRNLPPPPLAKHAPDLPSAVEPVLLRALSKRPGERYPSIRAFARALETAAVGSWAEVTPMQSDPTTVAAWPDLPRLEAVRRKLVATVMRLRTRWRVLPMKKSVLLASGIALALLATGLSLTLGRHHASAAAPARSIATSKTAAVTVLPTPPPGPEPATTATAGDGSPAARPSYAKAGRTRPGVRGSTAKDAGAKTNPFARPSAGHARGKKSRSELSVDDF